MHELSVTENILSISLEYAQRESAKKVTDLNIVIGRLSNIVDDSVQFYWDFVTENTICAGSKLHFDRKPAVLHCEICNSDFSIIQQMTPCPTCGGFQTTVKSGDEFFLDSIEIEK